MIRLWNFLIHGRWELPPAPCSHKYKIIKEITVKSDGINSWTMKLEPSLSDATIGFQYVLQCEHCGDIKIIKTYK